MKFLYMNIVVVWLLSSELICLFLNDRDRVMVGLTWQRCH